MTTRKRCIAVILSLVIFVGGCSFLGASVRTLKGCKVRYSETFDKDVSYCYDKTIGALKEAQAGVYETRKDDYIIAMNFNKTVFKACINTTEVGIFFTAEGPHKTRIDVSSLNYNLSKAVSEKIFGNIA